MFTPPEADTPEDSESDIHEDDGDASDKDPFNDSLDDSYAPQADGNYDVLDQMDLSDCIRYWALKTNQSHQSIDMIMEIIRRKTSGKLLPRSARTLLKTSRKATSEIVEIAGGQFWYNGLGKCLSNFFR